MVWLGKVLSRRQTAGIVVSVGLMLRLLALSLIARFPLASDSASYDEMALLLLKGKPFLPYWPPGVPLYLAVAHGLVGESALVADLAMLAFYLGLSCFAYQTAVILTGEVAAGNLSLLVLALSPATILASIVPMTELPAGMLLTIVAYCLVRPPESAPLRTALLLGASLGFVALVRPSSLILLALVPLYLLWRTRKLAGPAIVLLTGILMVGAWIGFVHEKTGRFVKINAANVRNLYLGNNPNTPLYKTWIGTRYAPQEAIAREAEFSRVANEHIRQHPGLFLLRSFNRVCVYFSFNTFAGGYLIEAYGLPKLLGLPVLALDAALYLLVGIGTILYVGTLSGMNPRTRDACVLVGVALLYAFPYFIAFAHPRFHYPIEPLLTILFSAFFVSYANGSQRILWEKVKLHRTRIAIALVVFGLIQVEYLVMMADRV